MGHNTFVHCLLRAAALVEAGCRKRLMIEPLENAKSKTNEAPLRSALTILRSAIASLRRIRSAPSVALLPSIFIVVVGLRNPN